MYLALLSLGRSAQSPAAVPSEIMPDARVDEGTTDKVPNILRFLVPCAVVAPGLLFVLREHKGHRSEPGNQQISSEQIHRKKHFLWT